MGDVPEKATKVSIDTPPLTVTVEHHHAKLDEVIAATLALYRLVYTPDMARPGSPVGFSTERPSDNG